MGTNYYFRYNFCEECGRCDKLHIGKSSVGWRFMFHYIAGLIENVIQWIAFINDNYDSSMDGVIIDEYGKEMKKEDFFALINEKQKFNSQSEIIKDYTCFRVINGFDFMEGEFS